MRRSLTLIIMKLGGNMEVRISRKDLDALTSLVIIMEEIEASRGNWSRDAILKCVIPEGDVTIEFETGADLIEVKIEG